MKIPAYISINLYLIIGRDEGLMYKRLADSLILMSLIFLYIFDNAPWISINKNAYYIYLGKPLMWLALFFMLIFLPKPVYMGKSRYKKFVRSWIIYLGGFYIALKIVGGLIHGFGKSPYNLSPFGIIQNLFLFFSVLMGREHARSYLINNHGRSKGGKNLFNYRIFIITFIFIFISIPLSRVFSIKTSFDIIRFAGEYLLPQISLNIFCTYLVMLGGAEFSILYLGIVQSLQYLSPILGDLKWITSSIIGILAPIFSFMFLQYAYLKESKEIKAKFSKKERPLGWIATSFFSVMIIWFFVGVFPVYPSVIVTGSMMPMIKPGDIVIVKKIKSEEVKFKDVVQYKQENIYIFHRIIDIVEENSAVKYKAKGDNNSAPDSELILPEAIKGKVIKVIPKAGLPALLLRDKKNEVPRERVEF